MRGLIAICLLVGTVIGVDLRKRNCHRHAVAIANGEEGCELLDTFEDPFGPNIIYGRWNPRETQVFSEWFSERFCIYVYRLCEVRNVESNSAIWAVLGDLIFLRSIEIYDSTPAANWIAQLKKCTTLRRLVIDSSSLSRRDIRRLASLKQIEMLELKRMDLTENGVSIQDFRNFHNLKAIGFWKTGFSREECSEIQEFLPNCEVFFKE